MKEYFTFLQRNSGNNQAIITEKTCNLCSVFSSCSYTLDGYSSDIERNTNNSIQHYTSICTQLNDCKYCYVSLTSQLTSSHWFTCCILTFESVRCSSSVNNLIAGRTCVNRHVTLVTTWIFGRCEILYTQNTANTGSLARCNLGSEVLGLDTVSHGDWPLEARWGNCSQWHPCREVEKAKMLGTEDNTTWYSQDKKKKSWFNMAAVFVSLSLPLTLQKFRFHIKRNKETFTLVTKFCGFFLQVL